MVWAIAPWNEMEQDTICNVWRASNVLHWECNVYIVNLHERVKSQINGDGWLIEKLHTSYYMHMVDENIT